MYNLLCGHIFKFLGYIIYGWNYTGSHANYIFNILRNCQSISKAAVSFYILPAVYDVGPISLNPHQHLLCLFLSIALLVGVKSYLTVVL